jgi:hypothetical protein
MALPLYALALTAILGSFYTESFCAETLNAVTMAAT